MTQPDSRYMIGVSLILERATVDAVTCLGDVGVRSIVLKGPLQQAWLSAAGPPRASVDVDVLVAPEFVARAQEALTALGYFQPSELPVEPDAEHSQPLIAEGRVPVEVHWTLVGADPTLTWQVLAEHTEHAEMAGTPIETLSEPSRCTVVALHAAQHGAGAPPILDDLDRALAVVDEQTWCAAREIAEAIGAITAFSAGLGLTATGRAMRDRLGVTPPTLDELQALRLITPPPVARGLHGLAANQGLGRKLRFLMRKLVPAPTFMQLRYPIARRGNAGLALAYLYRPLWLARWLVPGTHAWLRARRVARESRRGTHV